MTLQSVTVSSRDDSSLDQVYQGLLTTMVVVTARCVLLRVVSVASVSALLHQMQ